MKTLNIFLFFLFLTITTQAQFKSGSLQAAGLTCAMCTKAINESLKQLSFIESIKPDIKNSEFIIQFKPGAAVDPDAMKQAVEDAGFTVSRLRLTGSFDNLKLQKDAHVNIEGKTFHFINAGSQVFNGEKTITIVDKYFVSAKDFKKHVAATAMTCIQTGKAASCCTKENIAENTRVYHVVI